MMKRRKKNMTFIMIICLVATFICPLGDTVRAQSVEASLEQEIKDATEELERVQADYEQTKAAYDQGMLGFIDWMLKKPDLTELQITDLNRAKTKIQNAMEDSFLNWADGEKNTMPVDRNNVICVPSDIGDAVSLHSMSKAIPYLYEVNELRESDNLFVGTMKRSPSYVNFNTMAAAMVEADYAAGLMRHTMVNTAVESISFGKTSPVVVWKGEKAYFLRYMEKLGYTSIENDKQVDEITSEARSYGFETGHYTSMFYKDQQVMGMGYTTYAKSGPTHCYGAITLIKSESAYYTVEEYESLFQAYCETVDYQAKQEAVTAAQEKLDALLEKRYATCSEHQYAFSEHVSGSCVVDETDIYICSECGHVKKENTVKASGHSFTKGVCNVCKLTAPYEMLNPILRYNGIANSTGSYTLEEKQSVPVELRFKTASATQIRDEIQVEFGDDSMAEYEATSSITGYLNTKKPGITTMTIRSVADPSVSVTVKLFITDIGGHDFVLDPQVPGSGVGSKTCTKCHMVSTFTLPTKLSYCNWNANGKETSKPVGYPVGTKIYLTPGFAAQVQEKSYEVIASDPDKVLIERSSSYPTRTDITCLQAGDVEITVRSIYDHSVSLTCLLEIIEPEGHTYSLIESEEAFAEAADCTNGAKYFYTCTNCGHVSKTEFVRTAPLGHVYVATTHWISKSKATYSLRCQREDKELSTGEVGSIHLYQTIPATCTESEKEVYMGVIRDTDRHFVEYSDTFEVDTQRYAPHTWDAGTWVDRETELTVSGNDGSVSQNNVRIKVYECLVCHTKKTEQEIKEDDDRENHQNGGQDGDEDGNQNQQPGSQNPEISNPGNGEGSRQDNVTNPEDGQQGSVGGQTSGQTGEQKPGLDMPWDSDIQPVPTLKSQKIAVKVSSKTLKASGLKKKAVKIKLGAKAKTKLSYVVTKYPKKAKKYISVSKSGVVTMKKGAKKGTYQIKISAKQSKGYKGATKLVKIKVK